MKLLALSSIAVVSAADTDILTANAMSTEELKKLALSEVAEAIGNIESGLGIGRIGAEEKAAYEACMVGKVLPDKNLESIAHI